MADQLFDTEVVPRLGVVAPPGLHRVFSVVGGPPGSGKSTLARRFGAQRPVQHVSADAVEAILAERFPALAHDHEAFRRFGARLVWRLLKRSLEVGHDICFELTTPGLSVPFAQLARRERYYSELLVTALPSAESRARLAARNATRPDDAIELSVHDNDYLHWPPFLAEVEAAGVFDRIMIYDGAGRRTYSNHVVLRGGQPQWDTPPGALAALWRQRLGGPATGLADRIDAEIEACRPMAALRNTPAFEPTAAAARQALLSGA